MGETKEVSQVKEQKINATKKVAHFLQRKHATQRPLEKRKAEIL